MSNETKIKKLENGRAAFAYQCVEEAKKPGANYKYKQSDYRGYIKKIPVLIQTNGLGNTLAFIISKGNANNTKKKNNAYDLIYEQITQWLRTKESGYELWPENKGLLEFVISMPSTPYRQITYEVLALLNWLRRLAEGMIEGDDDET